jgi:CDP-diacylglycerol--glycerol-3-phosphate 3-phosphatidyltransferase
MKAREQRPYVLHEEECTPVTPAVQRVTDRVVVTLFLWAFPHWIRPNYLTFLRFALIPVVLVLLGLGHHWWAFGVFVGAVCTDFIDGAMARTRCQITILGTYIDPVADKLLIGAVLAWVGHGYLVVDIILVFIVLELILSAVGARILLRTGSARSSNAFGKTKMAVQSVGLFLFLIAAILDLAIVKTVALDLLWLALGLAFVSGVTQMQAVLKRKQLPGSSSQPGQPSKPAQPSHPSPDVDEAQATHQGDR